MDKAILITDMPERCDEHCPLYHRVPGDVYCAKGTKPLPSVGKPDWCPLIPEPPQATPDNSDMSIEWNLGWNACIDALEGSNLPCNKGYWGG